ncbi:hypothetical protein [Thiolapillus sp.]
MPSTLINNMLEKHAYPVVDENTLDIFLTEHHEVVLFFAENPKQFPESDDVAMILPELVKAFGGRFQAALVNQADEKKLQGHFGFSAWPSLVFLREGKYLGVISKVQNWDEYLGEINRILQAEPAPLPGIGVQVVTEISSQPH